MGGDTAQGLYDFNRSVRPYPVGETGILIFRDGAAGAGTEGGAPAKAGNEPGAAADKGGGDKGGTQGAKAGNGHDSADYLPRSEFDKHVAGLRRSYEAQLKEQKEELSKLSEKLGEHDALKQTLDGLRQELESLKPPDTPDDTDDPFLVYERTMEPPKWANTKEGRELWRNMKRKELTDQQRMSELEEQLKGSSKTIGELKQQLEERAERERQAELRALESDRMGRISAIVRDLADDVVDAEVVGEWVERRTSRDKTTGRLLFQIPGQDGDEAEFVPLTRENVSRHLKPSLRKSAVSSGGSGAGGEKTPAGTPREALSALQQQLETAKAAARKQPNNDTALAEVRRLQAAIYEAKKASGGS